MRALGYVGARPDEWDGFATKLLGMQRADRGAGGVRAFRMDDRRQRLLAEDGPDGLGFLGWEVADAAALDALAARLDAAGVAAERGAGALADRRHVSGLLVFRDPAGNRLEAFHGAAVADAPFAPGRPISGFRTGPLGMGHAVLHTADPDALLPFYRDLLGFRVSDFSRTPYPLCFFHLDGRQHSFAIVGSGRQSLHHFMVELGMLNDVGQG